MGGKGNPASSEFCKSFQFRNAIFILEGGNLMSTKAKVLRAATLIALDQARKPGTRKAEDLGERLTILAEDALVEVGKAAKRRQRRRKAKAALKFAGKAALVGGAAAATVLAVRRARARSAKK
jgi:hypothetical protein